MHWTVLRGNALQQVKWRNGLGTSRTIVTRLARDGTLLWQVGIADLLQDAPFSHYPHCDRVFTPIAGAIALSFQGEPFQPCPILAPVRFDGETPVTCRVQAPGRAFNVVTDRRHHGAEVTVLRLEAGDPIEAPDAPEVLVHCLQGELAAMGDLIGPGDTLMGPGPAAPGAASADTTAILVAIRHSSG